MPHDEGGIWEIDVFSKAHVVGAEDGRAFDERALALGARLGEECHLAPRAYGCTLGVAYVHVVVAGCLAVGVDAPSDVAHV